MNDKIFTVEEALSLALALAKKGLGRTSPNPPVGCVILDKNYRFLSAGFHARAGGPHAESEALKKIKNKSRLKGAHVFVTLEPCCHQGKTPPCAKALAEYSLASLTYGAKDPFTKGRGLKYLKKKTKLKIRQAKFHLKEMEELVRPFTFSCLHKKPFVSLKAGVSLDGSLALQNGKSQWITSLAARRHSHLLRAQAEAVLIGVKTLLKDNPRLIARKKNHKNKVIILDSKGESFSFLPKARILKNRDKESVIVCCDLGAKKLKPPAGVTVKFFKTIGGVFPLSALLKNLYKENQIHSILAEGGAFTFSEFLRQKEAQKLYLYQAPVILGRGLNWSGALLLKSLGSKIRLSSLKCEKIGPDFLFTGQF